MTDDVRAGHVVDGGYCHIHDQHGERDAVGVAAPGADAVDQETDAEPEDQPSPGAGCCGNGIGCDEERTQDRRAAEHVKAGARIRARLDADRRRPCILRWRHSRTANDDRMPLLHDQWRCQSDPVRTRS